MSHDPYAPVGKLLSSSRPPAPPPAPPAPEPVVEPVEPITEVTEPAAVEEVVAPVEADQAAPSPEDVIAQQLAALDALRESE